MTNIEKVARAIYEADDPWHKAWPWPDLQSDQAGVDQYRRIAEAAIAAMQPAPQEPVAELRAEIERNRAEIERLTKELRDAEENINLKAEFIDATVNDCAAKDQETQGLKEAHRAEIERLRGKLREIQDNGDIRSNAIATSALKDPGHDAG